ncbi:MAG: T9SS type A sorting domain-containing protein [Bacteroidetes bacterium]|nr:T9SS type A sorting domain-containing protein [Bacteroidota bacterium]MCW5894564.1 T9SS type A sorting domain-containing protein [Bacteroidota bacterium]
MISRGAFRLFSLSIALMFALPPARADEPLRTLQAFGVAVQHGQPVYPLPANVALGLYDPDPLLDLAYYHEGRVQVWRNLGNGTFGSVPVYEQPVSGVVERIEFKKRRMWTETIFDINSWSDLVLTFVDGHVQTISYEWMNNSYRGFAAMPQQTSGFPPLNFTEVWRSERNPGPARYLHIGDIDNDGRMELTYNVVDSASNFERLTVFENYGHGQYRVEWDSLMSSGSAFAITDMDNDGRKEIVVTYLTQGGGAVGFLECFGEGQFRFYQSNIGFDRPPFRARQTDIDRDGISELTLLTSDPNRLFDRTLIYVAKYSGKFPSGNGWIMTFSSQELARYQGYAFDMAVGQVDGQGREEIIPAGGSFGFHEPAPIDYLWYSGIPGPELWRTRRIHTGLQSGTGAVMFVNLDADTTMEFVSGAPGPVGHGSMFALKYVSDTTWSVLWADSSLRSAPLWVNSGWLNGRFVAAGANVWTSGMDTMYGELHAYESLGNKVGVWHRDSISIQQFHLLDVDWDGRTNLVFAQASHLQGHRLVDYESDTVVVTVNPSPDMPQRYALHQNYPNPFNPATQIRFDLPQNSFVDLQVYDIVGREMRALVSEEVVGGSHTVTWNGTNQKGGAVSSGVYFYRMSVRNRLGTYYIETKKMLLLR